MGALFCSNEEASLDTVRISVANLATMACSRGLPGFRFGVLNPKKLEKGEQIYQALGGAVELTPLAEELLADTFCARKFEIDPKTGMADARFVVDTEEAEAVLDWFSVWGRYSDFVYDAS